MIALYLGALPLFGPPTVQRSRYVTELVLPIANSEPLGIAVDREGTVWVALTKAKRLLSYMPSTQTFREFAIPTDAAATMIWDIAVDPTGRVWFPSFEDNAIWRFDPSTTEFRRYDLPTVNAQPVAVTIAPDSTVWFTELQGAKLGRIRVDSDRVEEFPVPSQGVGLGDLFLASDGTVWFTEIGFSSNAQNRLARFDPQSQSFTEFEPSQTIFSPTGIAVVNGEIWFAEHGGSLIGKLEPSSGHITRYATSPSTINPASLPYWLAVDSAGALWFNEHYANRMARFDPATESLVEYEVPTRGRDGIANVLQFTVAATGEVWFTEWSENKIGMVDPRVPLPFEVAISPTVLQLRSGAEVQTTIVVSSQSDTAVQLGASGSFTLSGRLLNVTALFEPAQFARVAGEASSILTLSVASSQPIGNYTLTVSVTDGSVARSLIVRLRVDAAE